MPFSDTAHPPTTSSDEPRIMTPVQLSRHYSKISQFHQILAGAAAGCVTRTVTQPFDVLKIRFQLQVEPVSKVGTDATATSASKYTSMWQATRLIYKEEGIRGLFKGHNAGQVMSITYAVFQFWSYEQIQLALSQLEFLKNHDYFTNFLSGGLAGSMATFITTPFDVIRTRLVAQDPGSGYRNIFHAFPHLWQSEGHRGLFRGLGTTLIQIGPLVGANFMFYHSLNDLALNFVPTNDGILPTWCLLLTGGSAGTLSKALIYPLDFIKKRLQMQGFDSHRQSFGQNQNCKGILHCIRLTSQHEGLMGFYKGMIPTLYKSGLTTALYFSIYDKCKHLLQRSVSHQYDDE